MSLHQTTWKRITVLFTQNEYDAIKRCAGDVPLLRWLRRAALHEIGELPAGEPLSAKPVRERKRRVIKPVEAPAVSNVARNWPITPESDVVAEGKARVSVAGLTLEEINRSLDARRAAPVDLSKILP